MLFCSGVCGCASPSLSLIRGSKTPTTSNSCISALSVLIMEEGLNGVNR